MKTKVCTKCKKVQSLIEFYGRKDGRSGGYRMKCKSCLRTDRNIRHSKNKDEENVRSRRWRERNPERVITYNEQYNTKFPWISHFNHASARCNCPSNKRYKNYGGRGIKQLMSKKNFKFLWFRDKAYLLKQASIDRIDNDGNYTLENCRFIEHSKNSGRSYKLKKEALCNLEK